MPRLLLVEDEESAAEVLATILELEGFHVTLAANGKKAIEVLDEAQPALIITDYMMPMMDGVEMARAIRAMPAYATVPILMTSGVAEAALKKYESLFSAFLRKPFKLEALVEVVRRLLGNASSIA
jgi:two-component system, OmpR family, response regulator VicR